MKRVKKLSIKILLLFFGIAMIWYLIYYTNGFWGDVLIGDSESYSAAFYYDNKIIEYEKGVGKEKDFFVEANLDKSEKTFFEINIDKKWNILDSGFQHNASSKYIYILIYGPNIEYDYEKVIIDGNEVRRSLSYSDSMLARIDLESYEFEYLKEIKAVNKRTPNGLKIAAGSMFYVANNNLYKVVPNRFKQDILAVKDYESEYCHREGAFYKFDFNKEEYIKLGEFNPGSYKSYVELNHYKNDYLIFGVMDQKTLTTSYYLSDYNGENTELLLEDNFLNEEKNIKIKKNGEEYVVQQFAGLYGDIMFINDGFKIEGVNVHTKDRVITFEYDTVRSGMLFSNCINDEYFFYTAAKSKDGAYLNGIMIFDENGKLVDELTTVNILLSKEDNKIWNLFKEGA